MATIISPSSPDDHHHIPTATLALPSVATASRRLPPPCWTPEETVALIDSYKDKWYSLRRGNLRANHWQEVAEDVASRCPANPPKTAVQCRHKMEKLRKRYRAEIQRSAGARRSASSWAHFQNMDSMEKGTNSPNLPSSSSSDDEEESKNNSLKRINDLYNHHSNHNGGFLNQNPERVHNGSTPGVRIKLPGGAAMTAKVVYSSHSHNPNPNPRLMSGGGGPSRIGVVGKRKERVEGDVGEVVGAIQALGEGFMRMEKARMEMAREIEEMRMEMELKRTEMILESQQRIVEAFAHAINHPKKNLDYAQLRT
ncbi:hypothetical protein C2S51_004627 [Perilla frutescens var. frutescens]|nr:hypothetical protein C2S51_004627 [Perilla frutescens var. frutescens]